MFMNNNLKNLIDKTSKELTQSCSSKHEAEQQAIWLIEEVTKQKHIKLLTQPNFFLTEKQQETLNKYVKERIEQQKPIQYIIGHVNFLNLKLKVKTPILIPRPETEDWVDFVIKYLSKLKSNNLKILDIGTGSGCIGLAIAKSFPNFKVTGIDINPNAINLANENKKLNKSEEHTGVETFNVVDNIEFIISDFYQNLENKKFDIIISNPPYICQEDWEKLDENIKNWEDKKALVAQNDDCLLAYRTIINNAKKYLLQSENINKYKKSQIFLELGINQAEDVKSLLEAKGFKNVAFRKDLQGIVRLVHAST